MNQGIYKPVMFKSASRWPDKSGLYSIFTFYSIYLQTNYSIYKNIDSDLHFCTLDILVCLSVLQFLNDLKRNQSR
jgi:hypothetical protein